MTPTCRHLHTSGRPCGSPALRGEPFCFHHHTARKPMPQRDRGPFAGPQLPAPDDFLAIQRGMGEVLRLLALDKLTDRRAQTLLNGLAKASTNLARHDRHEEKLAAQAAAQGVPQQAPVPNLVTDFVNDEDFGTLALTPDEQAQAEIDGQFLPDPIPLLTPDPSHATSYEEATMHQMHDRMSDHFRRERRIFQTEKAAELEAKFEAEFQTLYEARIQDLETLYEALFQARAQTLEATLAQTLEATLRHRSRQAGATQSQALTRIPNSIPSRSKPRIATQTNQYLTTKPTLRLQAPLQPAA